MVFSGFACGGPFSCGDQCDILRTQLERYFTFLQLASVFGIIGIFMVILVGHSQAQQMVRSQPMKMAAAEALWESQNPASFSLITIGNEPELRDVFAIRIPGLLSLLAYNRFEGEVKGIRDLQAEYEQTYGPGNYIPPIAVSYWSFRIMVGCGFLMFLLVAILLWQTMRKRPLEKIPYFRYFPLVIALPYLANTSGWFLTELGRQPWVVFGLMKTVDGASPNLSVGVVLISLIGFTLVYGVLMGVDAYLLVKFAKAGPDDQAESQTASVAIAG